MLCFSVWAELELQDRCVPISLSVGLCCGFTDSFLEANDKTIVSGSQVLLQLLGFFQKLHLQPKNTSHSEKQGNPLMHPPFLAEKTTCLMWKNMEESSSGILHFSCYCYKIFINMNFCSSILIPPIPLQLLLSYKTIKILHLLFYIIHLLWTMYFSHWLKYPHLLLS